MTAGAVVALLLIAGVALFVLAPLFRKDAGLQERHASLRSEEEDLASQHEMALGALRDLDDDRATGKVGDRDYEDIRARLTARAVEILKRQDEILAARTAGPRPGPEGR